MKVFHSIADFKSDKKTIVTLGSFDGVHVGHQQIINRLLSNNASKNFESLVLTFSQHPRSVLETNTDLKLLNSNEEKIALLEKKGIDNLVIHTFDKAFSELSGEEFVKKILIEQFHIKKIIIGYDHRFGKNRSANIDDLILFSKKYGFEVEQISAEEINDVSVSSTKIRKAITEGAIELANKYLGYAYSLTGVVVKGKQLGATIDYPTANIKITESNKLIPKNGVYVVECLIKEKLIFGMMNIGTNPTVGGTVQSIEVHFFDFNADLYNQNISVSVLRRLRAEKKFDSLDNLKEQLAQDRIDSFIYLSSI